MWQVPFTHPQCSDGFWLWQLIHITDNDEVVLIGGLSRMVQALSKKDISLMGLPAFRI
jgi:hypothetical protein